MALDAKRLADSVNFPDFPPLVNRDTRLPSTVFRSQLALCCFYATSSGIRNVSKNKNKGQQGEGKGPVAEASSGEGVNSFLIPLDDCTRPVTISERDLAETREEKNLLTTLDSGV